jgi:hypothetical protein
MTAWDVLLTRVRRCVWDSMRELCGVGKCLMLSVKMAQFRSERLTAGIFANWTKRWFEPFSPRSTTHVFGKTAPPAPGVTNTPPGICPFPSAAAVVASTCPWRCYHSFARRLETDVKLKACFIGWPQPSIKNTAEPWSKRGEKPTVTAAKVSGIGLESCATNCAPSRNAHRALTSVLPGWQDGGDVSDGQV